MANDLTEANNLALSNPGKLAELVAKYEAYRDERKEKLAKD